VNHLGLAGHERWLNGQECVLRWELGDWTRGLELAEALVSEVEAGRLHYLAATAFSIRVLVREARDESVTDDVERVRELAERVGDPQTAAPALAVCAQVAARRGDTEEAHALLREALEIAAGAHGFSHWWSVPLLWAAVELSATAELQPLVDEMVDSPWRDAARAACDGDFATAASTFARIGAQTAEAAARAYAARLLVARGDAIAGAGERALAASFYRSVGAIARLRRLDAALAASA